MWVVHRGNEGWYTEGIHGYLAHKKSPHPIEPFSRGHKGSGFDDLRVWVDREGAVLHPLPDVPWSFRVAGSGFRSLSLWFGVLGVGYRIEDFRL